MKKANRKAAMYSIKNAKLAKKRNAKGFTLVELIVVIAIIGILAVVLVPNMMKYVKNARLSNVNDVAAKVAEQANVIAAEMEMNGKTLSGTYSAAVTITGGDNATDFSAALNKAVDLKTGSKLTITFDSSTGQVKGVAYAESASAKYAGSYPTLMTLDDIDAVASGSTAFAKACQVAGVTATPETPAGGGE